MNVRLVWMRLLCVYMRELNGCDFYMYDCCVLIMCITICMYDYVYMCDFSI
jgi:hypothetical protein